MLGAGQPGLKEFREYHKPAVAKWADEHESDVRFYMYLQFLADEQLAQADAKPNNLAW